MLKTVFAAAVAVGLFATSASAVVLDIRIEADGGQLGPIVLDVTIDSPFDTTVEDSTAGLTINTLSPSIDEALAYDYSVVPDSLILGGGNASGILAGATDFVFIIDDLLTAPSIVIAQDSDGGQASIAIPVVSLLSVTNAAVPLPAPALLLLTGLGALALRRRA